MLRRCKEQDVQFIYQIEKESFKEDDVYSVELLKFLCSFCGDYSYVYLADGKPVGYIITCIENHSAHVISIAVAPQHRKRGVGAALLCTALELLYRKRVAEVYLEVRVSNSPAISFYRSAGFEIAELVKNYYSDGEDGYKFVLRDANRARDFCKRRLNNV